MQDWRILVGFLVVILVGSLLCEPAYAANATNTTNASTLANMSWGPEAVFWQGFGSTENSIFGGGAYVITGIMVLLIFAFLAFRYSASLDLITPFFLAIIIILAIYGFLPVELMYFAILGGLGIFVYGVIKVFG